MSKQIVLLHGWSQNAPEKLKKLEDELSARGWHTKTITLPGFGNEPPPPSPWGTIHYARYVVNKCREFNSKGPILFGYSFGGQIAVMIAACNLMPLSGLVLCESAAIRERNRFAIFLSTIARLLPTRFKKPARAIWERCHPQLDYTRASSRMKTVLSQVVTEDLTMLLPKVTTDTLIYWGDMDRTLPPVLGQKTANLIKNSRLVIIQAGTHSLPYTHAHEIAEGITNHFMN